MYKSKAAILDKLQQVRVAHKRIIARQDRIVIEKEGRHPADLDFHSFVTSARSIFQYALKEIEEARKISRPSHMQKLKLYENYVSNVPIIKFFGDLRNEETHVKPFTHHVNVVFGPKGTEPKVKYQIMKRCKVGPKLYRTLALEGRHDLIESLKMGDIIYQPIKCNDQDDLFELCQSYVEEIEKFIDFGVKNGLIT
jgi:hypothetical protein